MQKSSKYKFDEERKKRRKKNSSFELESLIESKNVDNSQYLLINTINMTIIIIN